MDNLLFIVTFLISLAHALPQAATATAASPTISLDYATIVPAAGNSSIGYYKYQNIPFAAVPTGSLRWEKPQWPNVTESIVDGSSANASVACDSEEDCLYMDIWMPANATGKSLPVMVWTYGGGFTGGSKSQNTPEGLFNLSTDFIFVAYNYRLGMTGLANGPTFLHEGGTSNLALWDVQHAFQWVQKYISAFGGNSSDVTAVGFSAGGSQVLFQLTRFAGHAEQLFKQAYVMSPGFVPGAGHQHAESFWQNVSTAVGCNGGHLDCMKTVDFTELTSAADDIVNNYTYQFQPRVDGDFVADTYEANLYQKRFNFTGPFVISHEQHEANSQAYSGVNTTEDVSTYLRIFFPAITDEVMSNLLELYPEGNYSSPGLRFADMKQSFDLTAHNLALTQALDNNTWNAMVALSPATHGTDQSYYWYSTYSLTPSVSSMGSGGPNGMQTNSTDSNSTSTGPGAGAGPGSTEVDSNIAVQMQKYLLSFVLCGNPNTLWPEDKLYWPKHNEGNFSAGTQMIFNDTFYLGEDDLAATPNALYWNKALWY